MASSFLFVALLLSSVFCTSSTLAQSSSVKVVDLGYATYQTNLQLDEGVTSFLGIRFGAPPVGNTISELVSTVSESN
jgi:hypothetical protein